MKSDNPNGRYYATISLSHLGVDGIPLLVEALADSDADVRQCAAQVLGNLKARNEPLIAGLRKALLDPEIQVSGSACSALIRLGDHLI